MTDQSQCTEGNSSTTHAFVKQKGKTLAFTEGSWKLS